jgi:hypothetical protein
MSLPDRLRLRPSGGLSSARKLAVVAIAITSSAIGIAFLAFMAVTLRKAFELASPWETMGYFAAFVAIILVFYRVCGLHRLG